MGSTILLKLPSTGVRASWYIGESIGRLTYKEHFSPLREKCMKVLNVLKCVSRTTYGSDRATLLLLYRSLLRSKLDYASIVYDSACKTSKRTLDTIHNAALGTVTGAFRTSPTHSILAEIHEQGWICRLPGARENITVCGVAPVPASTHRVS